MLKLGEKIISKLYLGDKAISKAYLGEKLVFNKKPYYCEVEYLESTGTQWIDLGYYLNDNSMVAVIASSTDSTQTNNTLLGCGTDGASTDRVQVHFGGTAGVLTIRIDGTLSANQSIETNEFVAVMNVATKKGYFNNTEIVSGFTGTICKNVSLGLFNRKTASGFVATYCAKARVKRVLIEENGVVVREFLPVLDWDMKPCMYDKVNKKFYYNQGTGEFIAGNVIPELTHTEIEYLEGDSVSYIDTGVIGRTGVTVDMTAYFPSRTGNTYIIGCAESDTERFYTPFLYGTRWSLYVGNSYGKYGGSPPVKEKIHFITKTTDGKTQVIDDNNANCSSYNTVETNYTMYLFGVNNYGTAVVGNSYYTDETGYLRIYDCKIYVDGTLVRDYVAVERSDGVKCLYDKVESKYYEFQTA